MVFWGDLYDDFLDHSGCVAATAPEVAFGFCVAGGGCVRWWAPPAWCAGGVIVRELRKLDHGWCRGSSGLWW